MFLLINIGLYFFVLNFFYVLFNNDPVYKIEMLGMKIGL